jgi:hypothetical protein
VPLHWDNFFEDLNDILNNPSTYPYLLNDNLTGALRWISQKTNPDVPATLSWILKKTNPNDSTVRFYHQKFFETIDLYQDVSTYDSSRIDKTWKIK